MLDLALPVRLHCGLTRVGLWVLRGDVDAQACLMDRFATVLTHDPFEAAFHPGRILLASMPLVFSAPLARQHLAAIPTRSVSRGLAHEVFYLW